VHRMNPPRFTWSALIAPVVAAAWAAGGNGGTLALAAVEGQEKLPPLVVAIDVAPGDPHHRIFLDSRAPLSVAILGSADLDAEAIDPATVNLAGAPVLRTADGRWDAQALDVNGDGRKDLVLRVARPLARLDAQTLRVELWGSTSTGRMITGAAAVLPMERRVVPAESPLQKQPPVSARIEILDRAPSGGSDEKPGNALDVAILGSEALDASSIDPATVSLAGSPVLETDAGELAASLEDINGDARNDLVVRVSKALLRLSDAGREATLGGQLFSGRTILGTVALEDKDASSAIPPFVAEPAGTRTFSGTNTAAITINDGATASPYPSQIQVSGLTGSVGSVRVTLTGFTHGFPDDVDVLLVSPSGKAVTIMSDVGGSTAVTGLNLTLSDAGASAMPDAGPLASGTFTPTNIGAGDGFFGAPTPLASSALANFGNDTPNGTWSLYIVDDTGGGAGSVTGGWSLEIETYIGIGIAGPTINDAGPASLYPAAMTVGGWSGSIRHLSVFMTLTHSFPDDLDVLLVGPDGRSIVLMSDAGGGGDVSNLTLTFDDTAPGNAPDAGPLAATTYKPTNVDSADIFPSPAPAPWAGSALSIFNGGDPNGTWRLYVVDDAAGDTGLISSWGLFFSFDNNDHMNIPAGAPDVTGGPATFYPSTQTIEGRTGVIDRVAVHIRGFTSSFPDDVDVLLVGPGGQNIVLMSDVGASTDVAGLDLTFSDLAAVSLPDAAPLTSGTYLPTNFGAGDAFPAPAPVASAATSLNATFLGTNPNGEWRLYVTDDSSGDFGSWDGWSLDITTTSTFSGPPITVPSSGTSIPYPSTLVVSGVQGGVFTSLVHLRVTHTNPDDLDILLQGPHGESAVLMSDAGGSSTLSSKDLTFGEGIPPVPDNGPISGAFYGPTDVNDGPDNWPAPAPNPPGPASLSAFNGADPNGTWSLFTVDDAAGNSGSIVAWDLTTYSTGPALGSAEVANLRWSGKDTLLWDSAANASRYRLYRGNSIDLPGLQTSTIDSCLRATTDFLTTTTGPILTENPAGASVLWYLVRAENDTAGQGPAGYRRTSAGKSPAEIQNSSGVCASLGLGACRQALGTCTVVSESACSGLSGCYGGRNTSCTDTDGDRIPDAFEIGGCDPAVHDPCVFGTDPLNPDTDGDSIKDGDEVYGTAAGLNLPAMGVDPCRKDILVETDWVQAPAVDPDKNKINLNQVARLQAAFNVAPVMNPNGVTGIKLHIDYGQAPYGGGNSVLDPSGNDTVDVATSTLSGEINVIKGANFAANRNGYFHYVVMCDKYSFTGVYQNSSGLAELPGDDFIVAMGQWAIGDADGVGNTLMHELGHNLNLRHGGSNDVNYKANYNSLMNYNYQFCGVDWNFDGLPDGAADYSRGLYTSLNEASLDETKGLTGGGPPIDWNNNGIATDVAVARNINCRITNTFSNSVCGGHVKQTTTCGTTGSCGDSACNTYTDQNDWNALVYTGLSDADFENPNKEIISCQGFDSPKP